MPVRRRRRGRLGRALAAGALVGLACVGGHGEPASAASCARCVSEGTAPERCAACPREVRAALAGKRLITRDGDALANDCLAFDPLHPMLQTESRRRWSKPLDRAEVEHASRYGHRRVRVLPGCAALEPPPPAHVTFSPPLAPEELRREDGTPKPVVHVDGGHPRCLRDASAQRIANPATPACDLDTALRATRRGDAIVEIAGGVYPETRRLGLRPGHVLVPRDDELVTITGWIDVTGGTDAAHPWKKAKEDATGSVWVTAWPDHRATGGTEGLKLPFRLDGREVPEARHFGPESLASDVEEIVFSTHPVGRPGDAVLVWADPQHPAACVDSGVNVKSRALLCQRDGERLPCSACEEAGIPVGMAREQGGTCHSPPGACAPAYGWWSVMQRGLEACRDVLGPRVGKCLLLKLPRDDEPGNHVLRASHTAHGFNLYEEGATSGPGVVLKGLRLENFPVTIHGRRDARSSAPVARLVGLQLDATLVELLGTHLALEDSYGRDGHVQVSGAGGPLVEVVLRNNVFDRYRGKPISWGERPGKAAPRSPARLHDLRPLCDAGPCAGPDAPVLFSGDEGVGAWHGWNRILFNFVRESAAINAFGAVSYLVVAGNVFDHGGNQEGILELPWGAEHVWVHHNWARDGIGTAIRVVAGAVDLVVSDNQLLRSPGDPTRGAGADWSRERCADAGEVCWGAHRSLLLKPGREPCRSVTVENNLSADSLHGGFAFQGCDGLTLRNNTATGSQRLPEWTLLDSPTPHAPARVVGNVASDPARPDDVALGNREDRYRFGVAESRENFLQGCDPGGDGCPETAGPAPLTTDPRWTGPPRYAQPAEDDYHLIGGWSGPDACTRDPDARYPHPGFCYEDERCASR